MVSRRDLEGFWTLAKLPISATFATTLRLFHLTQQRAGFPLGRQPDFATVLLGLDVVRLFGVMLQGGSLIADVLSVPSAGVPAITG